MFPKLGQNVLYTVNEGDVALIDQHAPLVCPNTGRQLRNGVHPGQVLPATIVAVFHPESTTVNLRVHLDGQGTYWATSRAAGEPGDPCKWYVDAG